MSRTERRSARSYSKPTESTGASPPVLFAVDVTTNDRETVLTLHGELDLCTRSIFSSALASIDDRLPCVVLDVSDLTFIDASSIGEIFRARKVARMRGGDLVLRSPSPHLSRILELTGLFADAVDMPDLRPIALPLPSRAYERASASPDGAEGDPEPVSR